MLVIMAVLYVAAGINHFANPEFYVAIMPPYLPAHLTLVYLSGAAEVVLGGALFSAKLRRFAAWGIITMLLVFMTVHIHMLVNSHLFPDVPVIALWLRLPLQALFIAWAYWYTHD
jgi:uncharacterized membrane protein